MSTGRVCYQTKLSTLQPKHCHESSNLTDLLIYVPTQCHGTDWEAVRSMSVTKRQKAHLQEEKIVFVDFNSVPGADLRVTGHQSSSHALACGLTGRQ